MASGIKRIRLNVEVGSCLRQDCSWRTFQPWLLRISFSAHISISRLQFVPCSFQFFFRLVASYSNSCSAHFRPFLPLSSPDDLGTLCPLVSYTLLTASISPLTSIYFLANIDRSANALPSVRTAEDLVRVTSITVYAWQLRGWDDVKPLVHSIFIHITKKAVENHIAFSLYICPST